MKKIQLPKMIDYYRKQNGLTMKELGKLMNKSESAISLWISGKRSPMVDDLDRLAELLNVTIEDLMFGAKKTSIISEITTTSEQLNEPRQENVLNFAKNELYEQEKLEDEEDYTLEEETHTYEAIRLAAGTGAFNEQYNLETVELCPSELPPRFDYVFLVDGDSMEPFIKDGDVIFGISETSITNGGFYAVTIDGEEYVKKCYLEDNRLRLCSLNKKYDDFFATEENQIRVIARIML
ncbi:Peptidase S24-like [Pilibacter termitis]|uniref:Peptidase S24-like n=1 Tax=Pilibacter termitis TaxID=263852 RepID=A0A1T4PC94_9ENTE|nr:S24 family peptidase [Pilibacter termitis]SJZ89144.1 Peptidase S24-like [Pilibacter termitis]